jgi:hypothetical protein
MDDALVKSFYLRRLLKNENIKILRWSEAKANGMAWLCPGDDVI